MATTFLTVTNEVLHRMNEVQLTSSNFVNARGFQIQCKNSVNDAINYINHREYNWPFNHSTAVETLVAGTARYTVPSGTKTVDYDTFRITKNSSLGTNGGTLRIMDYKEYVDRYIDQEDDETVQGAEPRYIVRTPDNNYLLYPYPDKAYELKFEYYSYPTQLSDATDVPAIPEAFCHIIADGATALAYQYRGEMDQYQLNWGRFQQGITEMQSILINSYDYVRSTAIEKSGLTTTVFPTVN